MILKILAAAVVLFLIYIVLFKKGREKEVRKDRKPKEKIEDIMVECPTCSTYVSKKEAILSNGRFFCSKECLLNK
ncbi:PP0621 family protein [Halarcobacter sp.]|uniref:PP0621 family protein n=1 Tax=Halarcobacter sp. TaxID=2321133 RepID=UPI003A8EA347